MENPSKFAATAEMLRITFPYLLFISMTGVAGAVLNSYDRFAVPAFTPLLLNVTLIAAALIGAPIKAAAISVTFSNSGVKAGTAKRS